MGRKVSRKVTLKFAKKPLAHAVMLALLSPVALLQAQENEETLRLEEVVVTAQKRDESMQSVPISLTVLSNQTLKELNILNFNDYAQLVPSITSPPEAEGGAFAGIVMRGVTSGSRGHPSSNSPTVGMYLDEMPITTQQGNLDIHLYDVSRIEVLAGPQGTLFGGSSQAGTIRIITNKPELEEFSAGVSLEGSIVDSDDTGYLLEGYTNLPINDRMAIRLVGWASESAGWIDNVLRSRTYRGVEDANTCAAAGVPCSADDITVDNANRVKSNYNKDEVIGGRAALRIDLNENWTVMPTLMGQETNSSGYRGEDISAFVNQKQAVSHIMNEYYDDKWAMVGLAIEGKIGTFDLTYAGAYLERDVDGSLDYADYAYFYDAAYTTGFYADLNFSNSGPRPIPNQFYPDKAGTRNMQGYAQELADKYERTTHEIRITSDQDKRVRGMLGLFLIDSFHDYTTPYRLPGLADFMQYSGGDAFLTKDTFYLNSMDRNDDELAIFGHVYYDITDKVELTVGMRYFEPEQTVKGFNGYSFATNVAGWASAGERRCASQEDYQGQNNVKPCLNVDEKISENESVYRANLTYRVTDDVMLYGTFSEGYRPGGINRNPNQQNYLSEFLTNYEIGWKTMLLDQRLQFNGAVFYNDWQDFQISFAGENGITQIGNGPSAENTGIEAELVWLATERLRISAGAATYDGELSEDFNDFRPDGTIRRVRAPKGAPLPGVPDFKGNIVGRYEFPVSSYNAYVQGADRKSVV